MCDSKAEGGKRCTGKHTPTERRAHDRAVCLAKVMDATEPVEPRPVLNVEPVLPVTVVNDDTVYEPFTAGAHDWTSPVGTRVGAATLKWLRGSFAERNAEVNGLTLRDYGKTEESYQTIFGFTDQAGGEWITVHDGDVRYRDPDENPRRTDPKAWEVVEIVEVTGDYERKLGELAGDWRSSFHRGPASVTSDAMDAVKVGLGDRWTPTYVTYGQNRLLRPEEVTDGHDSEDVLTLHAASGDVLASVHLPHETSMEDDQVDVGFKLVREAGWLSVLNADAILMVFIRPDANVGPLLFELRRNRGHIAALV